MWPPWPSILGVLKSVMIWIRRRPARGVIRVEIRPESGPYSRELGFTETAIKITVMNESGSVVRIRDIRLMFCGTYGAPVKSIAPPGRSHPGLPASLKSGAEENWYIPAEQLSTLLYDLYRPPSTTRPKKDEVKLHARCITGSGKVYKSPVFPFSMDPDSFFGSG